MVRLSRTFITDVPLAVIAVVGLRPDRRVEASFVLVLLGAGLAYELWTNGGRWLRRATLVLDRAAAVVAVARRRGHGLADRADLLGGTEGGAADLRRRLHRDPVPAAERRSTVHHWLTDSQFVDGLAMGGVLPAPLIIFSTFVGYVAGGLAGALVMTLGIFLPAFVFPIFFHRQLVAVAENARLHPFLLGVAAGVIGLIAAVTVQILDTSVVDVPTALLAIGAFLALNRWHGKLTVLYVVLGCGLIGGAATGHRGGLGQFPRGRLNAGGRCGPAHQLIGQGSQGRSEHRADHVDPEVVEGATDQRRADRAGRIHRRAGHRPAEEGVEPNGAADGDRGRGPTARVSVATAMITNIRSAVSGAS